MLKGVPRDISRALSESSVEPVHSVTWVSVSAPRAWLVCLSLSVVSQILRRRASRILLRQRQRNDPCGDAIAQGAALLGRAQAHRRHDAEVERVEIDTPAAAQVAGQRSARGGENHVVEAAPESPPDLPDASDRHRPPVDAPIGTHRLIEGCRRRDAGAGGEQPGQRAHPLGEVVAGIVFVARQTHCVRREVDRRPQHPGDLVDTELQGARHRPRHPGRRDLHLLERLGRQQLGEQLCARDPIHHAVVHLRDEGESIPLEPLDEPQLPERLSRSSCCENTRPTSRFSCRSSPGLGSAVWRT